MVSGLCIEPRSRHPFRSRQRKNGMRDQRKIPGPEPADAKRAGTDAPLPVAGPPAGRMAGCAGPHRICAVSELTSCSLAEAPHEVKKYLVPLSARDCSRQDDRPAAGRRASPFRRIQKDAVRQRARIGTTRMRRLHGMIRCHFPVEMLARIPPRRPALRQCEEKRCTCFVEVATARLPSRACGTRLSRFTISSVRSFIRSVN